MGKSPKTEEFKKMELLCKPFLSKFRALARPKRYTIPFSIKMGSVTLKTNLELKLVWGKDGVVPALLNRRDVRDVFGREVVAYIEDTLIYELPEVQKMISSIETLRGQLDELSDLHFDDDLKLWDEYVADKL